MTSSGKIDQVKAIYTPVNICVVAGQKERRYNKQTTQFNLRGMKGNLRGKTGRNSPLCILQSIGFIVDASTLIRTSSFKGVGTGTSTC